MAKWSGVLFIVGKPSATSPSGARGHQILMASEAVKMALEHLPGKPLWAALDLSTHRSEIAGQVGIVETAELVGDKLTLSGELFERDNVDLAACAEPLGLSYDANGCHVPDMRPFLWTIDRANFFGVTVLIQVKAAHKQDTSFRLEER